MEHSLWLSMPISFHSSREDSCKPELSTEQCEYRAGHWRYWYIADWVYGYGTVYFFCATIAVFSIGFFSLMLSSPGLRQTVWWRNLAASSRYVAYRRYEIKALRWTTPSVGIMTLIAIGIVFFSAMTLGPRPYYWANTETINFGNSPPIATRAGWIALACTPFMLVLGSKSNAIAALTGVSHEGLIVFHTWLGWTMLVLALIHTFPFIIYHIQVGDMVELWRTDIYYWTGVAALIPQAYLTIMSLPWIRNAYYEFFKATHFFAALLFMLFFFFHCDFTLTSCDYFIAAGALYCSSLVYSNLRTYIGHGVSRRATISNLAGGLIKITIPVNKMTWKPAQHMFLRFLTPNFHALTAHPFTICSIPSVSGSGSKKDNVLRFYVARRGGITGRLASAASKKSDWSVPVLLEGPYGGLRSRPLHLYDRSLIITCGSGAGFSLPFIMSQLLRPQAERAAGHKMQVVISAREPALIDWFEGAIVDFMEEESLPVSLEGIEISIHVTGQSDISLSASGDDEKRIEGGIVEHQNTTRKIPIQTSRGRPDLRSIIQNAVREASVSVGMAVCGPESVMNVVADEAAEAQTRILRGDKGAREVYLHSEKFGW